MHLEEAMDFLLKQVAEQEARFAARLAKHDEWLERLEGIVERLEGQIAALTAFSHTQQEQLSQIITVTREIANRHLELASRQVNSEERMNALIQIVDELIRREGGGRPPS